MLKIRKILIFTPKQTFWPIDLELLSFQRQNSENNFQNKDENVLPNFIDFQIFRALVNL